MSLVLQIMVDLLHLIVLCHLKRHRRTSLIHIFPVYISQYNNVTTSHSSTDRSSRCRGSTRICKASNMVHYQTAILCRFSSASSTRQEQVEDEDAMYAQLLKQPVDTDNRPTLCANNASLSWWFIPLFLHRSFLVCCLNIR